MRTAGAAHIVAESCGGRTRDGGQARCDEGRSRPGGDGDDASDAGDDDADDVASHNAADDDDDAARAQDLEVYAV